MEIDGTLKNARIVETGELRCPYVYGQIYGNRRGRFNDGETIYTSTVLERLPDGVFKTRYSVYKVELAT
jgi:hypothetical protein